MVGVGFEFASIEFGPSVICIVVVAACLISHPIGRKLSKEPRRIESRPKDINRASLSFPKFTLTTLHYGHFPSTGVLPPCETPAHCVVHRAKVYKVVRKTCFAKTTSLNATLLNCLSAVPKRLQFYISLCFTFCVFIV